MNDGQLERVPPMHAKRISAYHRKLHPIISAYTGQRVDDGLLYALARQICRAIRAPKPSPNLIDHLAGSTKASGVLRTLANCAMSCVIDAKLRDKLVMLIAGNTAQLRRNVELEPLYSLRRSEWALVSVVEAEDEQRTPKKQIPCTWLTLLVLSGTAAGERFSQFFTMYKLRQLAKHCQVIDKYSSRPLVHPRELVHIRFAGKLAPGTELAITEFRERDSLNRRNRELGGRRFRRNFDCPRGYSCHCVWCPAGYDLCGLATHPTTELNRTGTEETSSAGALVSSEPPAEGTMR